MTSWGDDDVRDRTPVDPWPAAEPYVESPRPNRQRRIYGYVYELVTGDPQDGPHPYAGQTTTTIHKRVHGPNGHTSPEDIADAPWKARILPGAAGYRCLRRIWATGDDVADQMRLDLAEAIAIDELKTTHNIQRPIRRAPRNGAGMQRSRPAPKRERRPVPIRALAFIALAATLTYVAARVLIAMQLPWPMVTWIGAPALGAALAWRIFWTVTARARKLMPRKRRARRIGH